MSRVHIFNVGKHTPMSGGQLDFSEDKVAPIAANYDPALSEAPVVIGHPKTDHPAYGWVTSLDFEDGGLFANLKDVDPAFSDAVKAGRYKKISASFYSPTSPNNPTPGNYYLRHVGFLGAMPPAVKGLGAVQFSEDDQSVTVEFSMGDDNWNGVRWFMDSVANLFSRRRDKIIEESGLEEADKQLPQWEVDQLKRLALEADNRSPAFTDPVSPAPEPEADPKPEEPEGDDMSKPDPQGVDLEAEKARLKEREEKLAQDEAAFADRAAKREAEETISSLVDAGKILPAEKEGMVAFMASLSAEDSVEFGEGDGATKTSPAQYMKGFLETLPKRVEFSEQTGKTGKEIDFSDSAAFAEAIHKHIADAAATGRSLTVAQASAELSKGAA